MISRGLRDKIPVNIYEGKLWPEDPLQAAKLASEAGIILRDHVPIFTHQKHYKEDAAKLLVKNYNDKLSVSNLAAKQIPIFLWFMDYNYTISGVSFSIF